MAITLYGIPNCDTVKKARTWLSDRGIDYAFHDFKKRGVCAPMLHDWCDQAGWALILNRAGTTFRQLPADDRDNLDQNKAVALMVAQTSMIKRPIVEHRATLIVGFSPDNYAKVFTPG